MISRRIDAALDAIDRCRRQAPALSDAFRPGTPERAALEDLMAALKRTDDVLFRRQPRPPCG